MSYPKWKYHKTAEPKVVNSEDEEKALGNEWAESPTDFAEEPAEAPVKKETKASAKSEEKPETKPAGKPAEG